MHESSLGIHEIKLVVKSGPGLSDGSGVAQHADSALDLGQVSSWDDSWGLVVDAHLGRESRGMVQYGTIDLSEFSKCCYFLVD